MGSNEATKSPALRWEDLAAHIRSKLLLDSAPPILETTPLISSGLLDSYSVVELVAHVEERCKIKVPPCWYRLEHLDSLQQIVRTVERIRGEHSNPT